MNSGEGKIEIPLEEFWAIVDKYHDHKSCEILYGVPTVNKENSTMDINYAFSSDCHPAEWVEKPECVKEWINLKG